MQDERRQAMSRRAFFRATGGASAAAAAAAGVLAPGTAQAYDPGEAETGTKYQPDAPDVQAFYRTNGYETLKK